ncbi:uncharacterized protein LOC129584281 [Paramacrobiotus metropolitanus]|uniref:uncharacterized protein LOC129584281 n=1 Tax=Paramacrobiotus metropolitanus TaxID=2943436 RepID=UPI0024461271|nr:uncharacterized protein LOC129584281 [Paramacrobiotus metropolitanus]
MVVHLAPCGTSIISSEHGRTKRATFSAGCRLTNWPSSLHPGVNVAMSENETTKKGRRTEKPGKDATVAPQSGNTRTRPTPPGPPTDATTPQPPGCKDCSTPPPCKGRNCPPPPITYPPPNPTTPFPDPGWLHKYCWSFLSPGYPYCYDYFNIGSTGDAGAVRYSGASCPISQFQCDNAHCVYRSQLCNGHNDCGDNSDEGPRANCSPKVSAPVGLKTGIRHGNETSAVLATADQLAQMIALANKKS